MGKPGMNLLFISLILIHIRTQVCNGVPRDHDSYAYEEKKAPAPPLPLPSMTSQYVPKQNGDLTFMYDFLKSYEGNYQAQVTMNNHSPISKLDRWNLRWEWMRGKFIYSMKGAYTPRIDHSECIHGSAAKYLESFDFSQVMNRDKAPMITDLPHSKANDTRVGYLNAGYKCGPPVRVDPSEFADPSGLDAKIYTVASWQVFCNITKLDTDKSKCRVSFTAFYSDSAIPCPTCACGCDKVYTDSHKCNPDRPALLLPPSALLLPAENQTERAREF
ncbi:hypothetical protein F3Y22_tig00112416pilonHSYRG00069 [Hibiscus syriacus]|uniref:COBRA C-terminal domain-containing protein n=1 Tax=Hibiscus syriacus TaxID=106335 RepID=A0A6A2WYW9_HIBSY|nr:hypothetical protein F3Y22_tig00112416pilonHSYRG00069 [Hibiscus syriacus]